MNGAATAKTRLSCALREDRVDRDLTELQAVAYAITDRFHRDFAEHFGTLAKPDPVVPLAPEESV